MTFIKFLIYTRHHSKHFQTFYLILIKVPETGTITPVLQIGKCMNGERVFSPNYTR